MKAGGASKDPLDVDECDVDSDRNPAYGSDKYQSKASGGLEDNCKSGGCGGQQARVWLMAPAV